MLLAMWLVILLVLGALGFAGVRIFAGYPRPASAPESLSRRELATLKAVSEALFPAGGAIPVSGREADVAGYVDRLVAASHPRQRRLIRALLFLVEHATLVFPAPGGLTGLRRLSSLDLERRVVAVEDWHRSRFFLRRLVFTSLRALCTLGYLAEPAVMRALHLAPYAIETPIVEADLLYPRIGCRSDDIRLGRADLTSERDALPPLRVDDPLRRDYAEEAS